MWGCVGVVLATKSVAEIQGWLIGCSASPSTGSKAGASMSGRAAASSGRDDTPAIRADETNDSAIGRVIGSYQILRKLGEGGMGAGARGCRDGRGGRGGGVLPDRAVAPQPPRRRPAPAASSAPAAPPASPAPPARAAPPAPSASSAPAASSGGANACGCDRRVDLDCNGIPDVR